MQSFTIKLDISCIIFLDTLLKLKKIPFIPNLLRMFVINRCLILFIFCIY